MQNLYHFNCPKCNNNHSFYRYGKDVDGYQKYQYWNCWHQFAPDRPSAISAEGTARKGAGQTNLRHPSCPVCGKASFLHHDYNDNNSCILPRSNVVRWWQLIVLPPFECCLYNSILHEVCIMGYLFALMPGSLHFTIHHVINYLRLIQITNSLYHEGHHTLYFLI